MNLVQKVLAGSALFLGSLTGLNIDNAVRAGEIAVDSERRNMRKLAERLNPKKVDKKGYRDDLQTIEKYLRNHDDREINSALLKQIYVNDSTVQNYTRSVLKREGVLNFEERINKILERARKDQKAIDALKVFEKSVSSETSQKKARLMMLNYQLRLKTLKGATKGIELFAYYYAPHNKTPNDIDEKINEIYQDGLEALDNVEKLEMTSKSIGQLNAITELLIKNYKYQKKINESLIGLIPRSTVDVHIREKKIWIGKNSRWTTTSYAKEFEKVQNGNSGINTIDMFVARTMASKPEIIDIPKRNIEIEDYGVLCISGTRDKFGIYKIKDKKKKLLVKLDTEKIGRVFWSKEGNPAWISCMWKQFYPTWVNVKTGKINKIKLESYRGDKIDWSFDGKRFLFSAKGRKFRRRQTHDIYVCNLEGDYKKIIEDASSNGAKWSPDGKRISFVYHNDLCGTYVANSDGTNIKRITTKNYWNSEWLDNNKIITERSNRILVRNVDNNLEKLIDFNPATKGDIKFFSLSPSKEEIFLILEQYNSVMRKKELKEYLSDLDGNLKKCVTIGDFCGWSPDGSKLLINAKIREGYYDLCTMDKKRNFKKLSNDPEMELFPYWVGPRRNVRINIAGMRENYVDLSSPEKTIGSLLKAYQRGEKDRFESCLTQLFAKKIRYGRNPIELFKKSKEHNQGIKLEWNAVKIEKVNENNLKYTIKSNLKGFQEESFDLFQFRKGEWLIQEL